MKELTRRLNKLLADTSYSKVEKVFCISMQRTGTTSVGNFFRDFGFRCAGWPADARNNWSSLWHEGNYERIFSSKDFRAANAFEDSPWWLPDFYKVLFHRFPNSKFVLFRRDPDKWFQSMIKHSDGNIIGSTRIHCRIYRREMEYYRLLGDSNFNGDLENRIIGEKTMKLIGHEDHYKEIYQLHNIEVQDFFQRHNPESLHVGRLEDPDKWLKLGGFLDVDVPKDYDSRENISRNR